MSEKPKREVRWIHPLHARGIRCSTRGMGNQVAGTLSDKRIRRLLEEGFYGREKKLAWLKVKPEVLRLEKERIRREKEGK